MGVNSISNLCNTRIFVDIVGYRQATWWDFVDIDFTQRPYWKPRELTYYIWSELKNELQEYHTTEAITWRYLDRFKDVLYVRCD